MLPLVEKRPEQAGSELRCITINLEEAWVRKPVLLIVVLALVAAACSSSDDDAADPTTTTGAGAGSATSVTSAPAVSETTAQDSGLTLTVAAGWSATALGSGVKPAIALDNSDSPAATWIFEAIGEGFIAYASAAEGWDLQLPLEGYFYGPIDLAFDASDVPNIAIHDHQADNFDPELGDLVRLYRDGSGWVKDTAADDGHDGWDSTITIGADGVIHAAGVDPVQFGREDGVEYYRNAGDGWEITAVGSGPIPYQYNIGLALDSAGAPSLTYYNDTDGDLVFASFDGNSWSLETVASDGDVGKYSSLAYDGQGRASISFFEQTGGSSGSIRFAFQDGRDWVLETVGELTGFSEGNARRNSSLAFDSTGRAHVIFSDTTGVWYSVRGDAGWQTEQIVTADLPLGQLVSLVLDSSDTPHLVLYEITSNSPLDGTIAYLTRP